MLVPIQSLPDGMVAVSGEMVMQTLVGATDYGREEGKCAWVVLSPEEKDFIGYELIARGAEVNRWYWCQLWRERE